MVSTNFHDVVQKLALLINPADFTDIPGKFHTQTKKSLLIGPLTLQSKNMAIRLHTACSREIESQKTIWSAKRYEEAKLLLGTVAEFSKLAHDTYTRSPRSKTVARKAKRTFSKQFTENLECLSLSPPIRDSLTRVLSHSDFPCRMAIGKDLVRNPVWDDVLAKRCLDRIKKEYRLDGDNYPLVMHLDMTLILMRNGRGRGELFTYYSEDWKTYFIRFRERSKMERGRARNRMNSEKLHKYCNNQSDLVVVSPLAGKSAISLKLHPKTGDLILYIFEFCSVRFKIKPDYLSHIKAAADGSPSGAWVDLDWLRQDPESWRQNADVVRALYCFFKAQLNGVPVSYSA